MSTDAYPGKILNGSYNSDLKQTVSDAINTCHAVSEFPHPIISYISAWEEETGDIWYEYASPEFLELMSGPEETLAARFRNAVMDQRIYKHINTSFAKEVTDKHRLSQTRHKQRHDTQEKGKIDAVYKIRTPDGRIAWYKDNATVTTHFPDGICLSVGQLVNVTKEMAAEEDLIKTEARLSESEQKFRTLFEQSNDAIIMYEPGGGITAANHRGLTLTGYSRDDLIGKKIQDVLTIDSKSDDAAMMFSEAPICFEASLHRAPGNTIDVEIHCGMIDTLFSFQAVIRDLSSRRALETERLKTGRLEVANTLAAGVSHDFNNILSIILGNVSLATMYLEENHRVGTLLHQIEKAANLGRSVTEAFIGFSQNTAPKICASDLALPIREAVAQIFTSDTPKVEIQFCNPQPPVWIDGSQIRTALGHLLQNAKESVGENGKIHITTSPRIIPETDPDLSPYLLPGSYAAITITDNGTGIPQEQILKIFDPYFSTKERGVRKGMGLGLTLAYATVKQHRGHISIQSTEGQGTTVSMFLPSVDIDHVENEAFGPQA